MNKTLPELKRDYWADFDRMGEDFIRLSIAKQSWSGTRLKWAIEWLAIADQKARERNEVSQAESLETAKSAKDAAWDAAEAARDAAREAKTANIIATLALVAAAIAIAISIIGIFVGS